MDAPSRDFVLAGSLEGLKAKGRLVLHGSHRPILIIYDHGRIEWVLEGHQFQRDQQATAKDLLTLYAH